MAPVLLSNDKMLANWTGRNWLIVPYGVYCGQLCKAWSPLKTQRVPFEMGRKGRPPAWGKLTYQEFLLVQAELVMICVVVVTHAGGTERTLIKFAGTLRMVGDVAVCQLYVILDLIVWPPNFYLISGIKLLCLCLSLPTLFNYVILFSFSKWYRIKGSKKKARIWIKSYKDGVVRFLTYAHNIYYFLLSCASFYVAKGVKRSIVLSLILTNLFLIPPR